MNLHLFGSSTAPARSEVSELTEPSKSVVFTNLTESLDEGDEYADDALRMADQPFSQE